MMLVCRASCDRLFIQAEAGDMIREMHCTGHWHVLAKHLTKRQCCTRVTACRVRALDALACTVWSEENSLGKLNLLKKIAEPTIRPMAPPKVRTLFMALRALLRFPYTFHLKNAELYCAMPTIFQWILSATSSSSRGLKEMKIAHDWEQGIEGNTKSKLSEMSDCNE